MSTAMNFASNFSNTPTETDFSVAALEAPHVLLDKATTYNRPMIITCDGFIDYDPTTGVLSWSGDIHIYFTAMATVVGTKGKAIHNVISADSDGGEITLTDNKFAYVTLSETDDAEIAVSSATITTDVASNFITYNLLVLGYRNTVTDDFFPVALKGVYFPTAYKDIQFSISRGTPGPSTPSWEAFTTNTKEYAFAVDENIDLEANELIHEWVEGSTGKVHIHFTTNDAVVVEEHVAFIVYIAYQQASGIWTETSVTANSADLDGSADLEGHYLALGDLTLTGITIGKQVKMRVQRIDVDSQYTEYGADIFINQVGMHLLCDYPGSRLVGTK